jgi:transcriptional regulator with XRE-family HTH domain
MDDHQLGAAARAIRQRKGWRQQDLALRAGVSRSTVGRIERGSSSRVPLGELRRVAQALDARIDMYIRWQGGDLARLVNARHAAMHEALLRQFAGLRGWIAEPEVSFSVYGERGIIDVLAWHAATRSVLVIELKTELVDISELLGTLDRKRRLSATIARERHWDTATISAWVVVADGRTNRRILSGHAVAIRSKLPADGRTVGAWLQHPAGPLNALSFLPSVHLGGSRRNLAPVRRVRRRPTPPARA